MARERQSKHMEPIDVEDSFHERCQVIECGCWIWTGPLSGSIRDQIRYPLFWDSYQGRYYSARQWAYRRYVEYLPRGTTLTPKCERSNCVNPEHMHASTKEDRSARKVMGRLSALRNNLVQQGHDKLRHVTIEEIKGASDE